MKLKTLLILTPLMIADSATLFGSEMINDEKPSFFSRAYDVGAGIGSLALSLSEIGSACAIGYFIQHNVRAEMNEPAYQEDANKRLFCKIISLIGFVATPSLLYLGWKTGDFSVKKFQKGLKGLKKPWKSTSEDRDQQETPLDSSHTVEDIATQPVTTTDSAPGANPITSFLFAPPQKYAAKPQQ